MSWQRYLIGHKEGDRMRFDTGVDMLAGDKFQISVAIVQVINEQIS